MLAALLILQVAPAAPAPLPTLARPDLQAEYDRCLDQAVRDPAAGQAFATAWGLRGGGYLARQCLGMAYASLQRWTPAAQAFEEAARLAEVAREPRTANYWAQAGNAWLADGKAEQARLAIDAALALGTLRGEALGEAHLDRARALVAAGNLSGARADLDAALASTPDDPLAWLLSATLARRTGDLARAGNDIAEAVRRAPDDASVQLEAGNVAALRGETNAAIEAWRSAARIGGSSEVGIAAAAALKQFGEEQR